MYNSPSCMLCDVRPVVVWHQKLSGTKKFNGPRKLFPVEYVVDAIDQKRESGTVKTYHYVFTSRTTDLFELRRKQGQICWWYRLWWHWRTLLPFTLQQQTRPCSTISLEALSVPFLLIFLADLFSCSCSCGYFPSCHVS